MSTIGTATLNEQIINSSKDGIVIYGSDLTYKVWNPAMELHTGYKAEQVLGKHPLEVFPFLKDTGIIEGLEEVLRSGITKTVETPFSLPNGVSGWGEDTSSPLKDAEGNIVGVLAVVRNITERKKNEDEYKSNTLWLHEAQAVAKIGSWLTDFSNMQVKWSLETHRIFGTNPETFSPTHQGFLQFVHPDDRARVDAAFVGSTNLRTPNLIEHRIVLDDGQLKIVEERWQVYFDEQGKPLRAVGTCRDVTEHKRAEENLKSISQRLLLATESAKLGVWDWDVQNNFMLWDNRMLELYGLTQDTFPGGVEAWQNGLHPDDRARTVELCAAALRGEKEWDTEFRVIRPDGKVRHIKAFGSVLRDSTGKAVRILGVNSDITDEIQIRGRLAQAEKLAAVGQLASGVAHEFNNILAIVRTHAQIALLDDGLTPKTAQRIEVIDAQTRRGATIVSDLGALAKADSVAVHPCPVAPVVEEALTARAAFLDEHKVAVTFHTDHSLMALAEHHRLVRIFDNLIVNACHAMKAQGGGKLTIICRERNGMAEIAFSDSGPGMDADVLAKVFLPFFTTKGSRAGDSLPGSGLGLWVCHSIAHAFGGDIGVTSEPGQGATFTVTLPLAKEVASPVPAMTSPATDTGVLRRCRVLLVDDEPSIITSTGGYLADSGHEVTRCASAEDALPHLTAGRFDLALIDFNLPRMNGRELARCVREKKAARKIAFITGMLDADDTLTEETARGDCAVLAKPFDLTDLQRLVRASMAGSQ